MHLNDITSSWGILKSMIVALVITKKVMSQSSYLTGLYASTGLGS